MEIKKMKNFWLFSIFIILVIFVIYIVNINKEENNIINNSNTEKYQIVKNYNDFYTVNSCIYRYLSYLQASNSDALLKILDENFIKTNSIDKNNLFNYLKKYEGNLNFSSKKMYEEKITSNITKYYVYGYVEKDIMDSFPKKEEAYFVVRLDKKNTLFSIEPYDGTIFR